VWGTNDPTKSINQSVVAGPFRIPQAGPLYGSPDKIAVPHTFAVPTPTTIQPATVYLQSGLHDSRGVSWNPINPGITPSAAIYVGTVNGRTIDGTAVTQQSLTIDQFAATNKPVAIITTSSMPALPNATQYPAGTYALNISNVSAPVLWRVNPNGGSTWIAGITSADTDSSIVSTAYLVANYITAASISAAYASFSYLSANYTTTTTLVATYASLSYLSANYITASTIAATYATFSYLSATYATISSLSAITISANNITAGTISATITITAPTINGGSLSGTSLVISSGGITINIDTTNLIKVTDGGYVCSCNGNSWLVTDGSNQQIMGVSSFESTNGTNQAFMQPGALYLKGGSTVYFAIDTTTTLTATSATAGSATLPASPVGFLIATIAGVSRKIPYYAT
jgi:hypothetical protein